MEIYVLKNQNIEFVVVYDLAGSVYKIVVYKIVSVADHWWVLSGVIDIKRILLIQRIIYKYVNFVDTLLHLAIG
jgi:hypothetical protein